MSAQEFNDAEKAILQQAQGLLFQDSAAIVAQINRTKAEQKAYFAAQIQAQITALETKLNNVDNIVAQIKTDIQNECNAKISLLSGLKTKLLNLPE